MWRAGMLLVASLATVARADDIHDAFGLKKKKPTAAPLDCSDGHEFGCASGSDPLADAPAPYSLSTWLPARYLRSLPVADASHDAVAHYALGATRDDAGVSMGGAGGLENRWTIEGAPADGTRNGAADTRVPLAFLDGILVTAGGFAARDRTSTGGTVDARLRTGTKTHEIEISGWAGISAPARQRPVVPFTFFARRGQLTPGPEASVHAVATGPVAGGWYAVGLGTEVTGTRFTWTSGIARDRDGDGMIDGLPGVVPVDRVDRYSRTPLSLRVPFMLRAGLDRGVHHFDATLVGSAGTDTRFLYNSTLQAAGVSGVGAQGDAIATWRGTWKSTRARAQLAWHRAQHRESARDPAAANIPQVLSAYIPTTLADDPVLAAACNDDATTDPYPLVTNCPVPTGWFASGGAGPLTSIVGDRPSLTADVAHREGNHVLRAGATAEDTRLVTRTHFTGGTQIRSLFPEHRAERRFVDPDQICNSDASLPCPTIDESVLRYRTRYTAAYLEDTWHAAPDIQVDGGMRWELMWVGTVLHFSDQLAPRLGVSWDPLGGGRSRVWASMGRSHALLPAGLGQTLIARDRTVDRITSPFGEGRGVDTGSVVAVAPGVLPIAQDEVTTGAEVAVARAVKLTTWVQGRWLRRGLDTTTSGFDNPGRTGGTPAIRETQMFAVELATAPTARLALRAGYMYGRTRGTWSGAADLYAGPDYDTTSINLLGRLPTDLGHRTYIEAARTGTLGGLRVGVALRLTAGSGRPRSAIGAGDDGIIYLIPRGAAGQGPLLTQANVRMGARWHDLDITLDVFNAFDRREATGVDEIYASGALHPIVNGTPEDLVFLKTETGADSTRRASYAHATSYQAPLSAMLGIRQLF